MNSSPIDTAGKGAKHLFVADAVSQFFYCGGCEGRHCPFALAFTYVIYEVAKHCKALNGVSHLGVELHGVELLFGVFHCGDGAVPAACGHTEAGRYFVYIIRMAHPAGCRFADIAAEQKRAFIDSDIDLTEFAAARFDDTAEGVRHKLCAVAYAEDRDAELKKRLVVCHGIFAVHTFRTACQDYALVACRFDLLKRRGVRAIS